MKFKKEILFLSKCFFVLKNVIYLYFGYVFIMFEPLKQYKELINNKNHYFFNEKAIKILKQPEVLNFFQETEKFKIFIGIGIFLIFFGVFRLIRFYFKHIKRKKEINPLFDKIKNQWDAKRYLNHVSFEEYVAYLYRKMGYNAKRVGFGADVEKNKKDGLYGDGGKDVIITKPFSRDVIIQCKFYNDKNYVGVSVVREMFATMIHYGAKKVIIITTSVFSQDAKSFAKGKKIELIDAYALDKIIKKVQKL